MRKMLGLFAVTSITLASLAAAPQTKNPAMELPVGVPGASLTTEGADRFVTTPFGGAWQAQNVSGDGATPGKPNAPQENAWGYVKFGNAHGSWFQGRALNQVVYADQEAPAAKLVKDMSVWLRKTLDVAALPSGRRIRFVWPCRNGQNVFAARLYVNGKFVEEPIGPTMHVDITDFLKVGANDVRLYCSGLFKGTEQKAVGISTHPMPSDLFGPFRVLRVIFTA